MREAIAAPQAGDRFELRGQLGAGGMGVVYRVFDRVRGRELALKTLKSAGGRELYRFKREFRALADLSHPNLITLHELYTVGDEWMFTMELVDGVPFHTWVRPTEGSPGDPSSGMFSGDATEPTLTEGPNPVYLGALDEGRLRAALHQLVDGVSALHAAGKLHRDVKPSNVLCERDRVVILDFGLIADVDAFHVDRTHERAAVGTPAYMSPEQAADKPLTDASDWYSVGVMLYEALTGRRPFEGAADQMLNRKQKEDPVPPRELALVPEDLEALCLALLARDPMERPSGREVAAALGGAPSEATGRIAQQAARGPFVGRVDELATLRRALVDSRQRCVATLVLGRSGIGKSAVVRALLDEASVDGETVILEGRCYERETVPYKALDQVIDGLTAYLMRLPREHVSRLVPAGVEALVRLFPVMRRVPGLIGPSMPGALPGDPVELRRRAFGALRELLAEIAEMASVVIAIDDLQWGDIDGAWALAELIRGPNAPRMLVVVSHRREDVEGGEVLATLRRWSGDVLRELPIEPLGEADARALWTALGGDARDGYAVLDAQGNPLLLAEIANVRASGGERITNVDDAIRSRVERLDGDARAVLHAIAVAVRPLGIEVATLAAGLRDASSALATLRMDRLVRVRGGADPVVEPYHDRIREAVAAAMTADQRRGAHAGIARALATEDTDDRELMIEHWLGAGDGERAGRHAERAALLAEERFAFHRASELYALALLHGRMDDAHRCGVTARRAHTLAAAGRLVEAAVEFRAAASLTHGRGKRVLERRSCEQLLRAGHLDRGLAAAEELLDGVGVQMPKSWRRTLIALAVERARIRMRGLAFTEKPSNEVDPEILERLDVLWSVSSGFTFVNPVLGRVLQARLLRESLAIGELRRVVLAYSLELGYHAMAGTLGRDRAEELLAQARGLSTRLGIAERGFVEASGGVGSYLAGRFREAHDRIHAGELKMRQNPLEVRWQLDLCEIWRIAALWNLGELRELLRIHPEYLRAAEERGNVYGQRGLRGWRSNTAWLIQGDPATARAMAAKATPGRTSEPGFHLHHYYDVLCHTMIELYERDGDAAFTRMEGAWRSIEKSHLLRIQSTMIEATWLRGTAAVAGARHDRDRLRLADTCARTLEKIPSPYARVLSSQLRAAAAARRGARDQTLEALRSTIESAEVAEMAAHHATARLRLGALLGGDEGRSMVDAATRWMREQGVADPASLAAMLSPGLVDVS